MFILSIELFRFAQVKCSETVSLGEWFLMLWKNCSSFMLRVRESKKRGYAGRHCVLMLVLKAAKIK